MSDRGQHSEWLSLIEVSGPFLAEPVLKEAFPQGLEGLDAGKKMMLRQAYDEWREAVDLDDPDLPKLHRAWIDFVLRQGLELDEDGKSDILKAGNDLPQNIECVLAQHGVTLRSDYAVVDGNSGGDPRMLVAVYEAEVALGDILERDGWAASPAERMVELCRSTGVRLGLVTNGEQWMFVDAPVGKVTSFASWYARHWGQESVTLQAFVNLLGIRRFFVDTAGQLPALLDKSLEHQDEVTDALGEQVRRAVEVLIQALDRANVDRDGQLLKGVEPAELYEAALTVMMRIVFLLSAEERNLLLMGDPSYEQNYAVSTLRMQLRSESDEILERRWDAWSRLLSIFRVVYAGIEHDALRLPALGGSLFDPDRFPFLEGRTKGSNWKTDSAIPLPIDNRTVLLLLEAVQTFQGRTLSYRALDVEQMGYVYEGLLERTASRAIEVTLDLTATKSADRPWVTLPELDDAIAKGEDALEKLLKERTRSSVSRIRNDLRKEVNDVAAEKLLTACHGDRALRDRLKPYFHLLRTDPWGYPLVYPKGTFMVTMGTDRRETGTHYTPKSLTEAIVEETLEPLAYVGPAEGKAREEWQLKSTSELFELKICDPAMGSGAFLVQVCRWLSERIVEAWAQAEKSGKAISSEGEVLDAIGSIEPLRESPEERLLTARRLVAERCLYGVDVNPLAVELAKLSIWLVTLAKGRPFGFLDHNIRCGDSLLGIDCLEQLQCLEMKPDKSSSKKLFAAKIDSAIQKAIDLRQKLRRRPIRDIRDVEVMADINDSAHKELALPELIADALVGECLAAGGKAVDLTSLSIEAGGAIEGRAEALEELRQRSAAALSHELPNGRSVRRTFHWPLEFPEVFIGDRSGFDAFVGNPPFLGGKLISGAYGNLYQKYLIKYLTMDRPASVDLVVHFFLRVRALLGPQSYAGLLGRRSMNEAKNREVGFRQMLESGVTIYFARTNLPWPGKAAVVVHQIHMTTTSWSSALILNGVPAPMISADLTDAESWTIMRLQENLGRMFQGSILSGEGFKIDDAAARSFLEIGTDYTKVVFPFIVGDTINTDPLCRPICWVVCFWDWTEDEANKFPEAMEVAAEHVRPERMVEDEENEWWRYLRARPELYHAIGRGASFMNHPEGWLPDEPSPTRVLAISTSTTKYPAFTYLPTNFIYSNTLCLLADERYELFAALSSDVHAIWAWARRTTRQNNMDSMRYAHGLIFETFPFPEDFLRDGDSELKQMGQEFFEARKAMMEELDVGLTGFYNLFHDPKKDDTGLLDLRQRQADINRAVLSLYGWSDAQAETGFHEVAYLPAGNTRFTISEPARLEILKRLAKLNNERFKSQQQESSTFPEPEEEVEVLEHGLFAPRERPAGNASG